MMEAGQGKSAMDRGHEGRVDLNGEDVDETVALLSTDGEGVAPERVPNEPVTSRLFARVGGLLAIVLMIVTWIATAELVQGLTPEYPHPFAICFCTRLGWGALLLAWGCWRHGFYAWEAPAAGSATSPLGPFGWRHYIKWAAVLSMVGLMSAWTWYISLSHTPLPANTAVYQTAPVFVFLFSVPILKEKVTWVKVISTVVCVAGASLVSFGKGKSHGSATEYSHQGFGFAMCALSTVLYAGFEVVYKLKATDVTDPVKIANAFRFIGLIGAAVVLAIPLFPILHYSGVETFELPNSNALKLILLNCLLDAVFNTSLLVAIMLTSPLFCSVATVLTLPASIVGNVLLHKPNDLNLEAYVGCVLISVGFLALTFGSAH
eukprot:m.412003 g.412003  ORF g.412003 m.412003 type:complete len:376 (-) comp28772_c0_seq1:1681-2808(-)